MKLIPDKFTDYRVLVQLCTCSHLQGSHKFGMCYGGLMINSCKCKEFQLTISNEKLRRVNEFLADDAWKDTE